MSSTAKKSVQLSEVQDAQRSAKKHCNQTVEIMEDLRKLIAIEALETEAPYLVELGEYHKGICKDVENIMESIKKMFDIVVKDAEKTVKNASSLRTEM